jgi:hypothetical protein
MEQSGSKLTRIASLDASLHKDPHGSNSGKNPSPFVFVQSFSDDSSSNILKVPCSGSCDIPPKSLSCISPCKPLPEVYSPLIGPCGEMPSSQPLDSRGEAPAFPLEPVKAIDQSTSSSSIPSSKSIVKSDYLYSLRKTRVWMGRHMEV